VAHDGELAGEGPGGAPRPRRTNPVRLVSVLTPALDEAAALGDRARELAAQEPPWEWIVSDGGSRDGTPELARSLGARVVVGPRGRGLQLAAAAGAARGDALLVLHADTALPRGALAAIRAALADATAVGGNFTLRFGSGGLADRVFESYCGVQQRLLGVFFGDSALFVRTSAFHAAGGFSDAPVLEDLELVRRLRSAGRLVRLPLQVRTSDRRYRGRVVRTVATWAALVALYAAGVAPRRLARLYPPHAPER
jgi:rSAM/selenodomain-associated transferase 2